MKIANIAGAMGGSSRTYLTHLFGRGLDDEKYRVERFRSMAEGMIRHWHGVRGPGKARNKTGDLKLCPVVSLDRLHVIQFFVILYVTACPSTIRTKLPALPSATSPSWNAKSSPAPTGTKTSEGRRRPSRPRHSGRTNRIGRHKRQLQPARRTLVDQALDQVRCRA